MSFSSSLPLRIWIVNLGSVQLQWLIRFEINLQTKFESGARQNVISYQLTVIPKIHSTIAYAKQPLMTGKSTVLNPITRITNEVTSLERNVT